MEESIVYHVRIQPEFALGRFVRQVNIAAHGWRILRRSAIERTYWDDGAQRITQLPTLTLSGDNPTETELIQAADAELILSVSRSLLDYIDTILGLREFQGKGYQLDRDITSEEDFGALLDDLISEQARAIGSATNLDSRKKLARIGQVSPIAIRAVNSLLDIRNALEHHKRVATKKNITLEFLRLKLQIDGQDLIIEDEPLLLAGQELTLEIVSDSRSFSIGEPILLSELDIEIIIQSLVVHVGPELLRAAFPPAEESPESEVMSEGGVSEAEGQSPSGTSL